MYAFILTLPGVPFVYYGDEKYIICINATDKKQEFDYEFDNYEIVMKNDDIIVERYKIILKPISFAINKL